MISPRIMADRIGRARNASSAAKSAIGMAEMLKEADLSHSYRRADESLYQAKKSGKNRYVLNAA